MKKTLRFVAALGLVVPLVLAPTHAPAVVERNGRILINETFTIGSMRPDGTGWGELATGDFSFVRWSPDKTKITYVGDEGDHLWAMDADGSDKVVLADTPRSGGSCSPDSTRLVYFDGAPSGSPLEGACIGIWVVDASSGKRSYAGDAPNCIASDPQWSPEGDKVAFVSGEGTDGLAEDTFRHIYSMKLDDGATSQLTSSGAFDLAPRWSPEGAKISFQSTRDHTDRRGWAEVYVMRADGSRERRLTRSLKTSDVGPFWSDQGRHVAWTRSVRVDGERRTQAWVMRPDGSGKRLLSPRRSKDAGDWDFSPDGRWLLYTAVPPRRPYASYSDLYKVRLDASRRVRLTRRGVHSAPRPDW